MEVRSSYEPGDPGRAIWLDERPAKAVQDTLQRRTLTPMTRCLATTHLVGWMLWVCLSLVATNVPAAGEKHCHGRAEFFPPGALGTEQNTDFVNDWYSSHLRAMAEPSLWEQREQGRAESYRFLWLRTFNRPIAVRVSFSDSADSAVVTVKVLSGAGGYEPGRLVVADTRSLDPTKAEQLRRILDQVDFWSLPTSEENDLLGVDGAQWIVEGLRDGQYHVVDRWSPDDGPVRRLGLSFLELARLDEEPIY